jgi:hypothetical protein
MSLTVGRWGLSAALGLKPGFPVAHSCFWRAMRKRGGRRPQERRLSASGSALARQARVTALGTAIVSTRVRQIGCVLRDA